jgi:hypothetical protein
LATEGCNPDELQLHLLRIRRSANWERISNEEVVRAIKVLTDAKGQILRLKQSELGRRIFEHLVRADELVREIEWVIAGTEQERGQASARLQPRTDSAWAELVNYVRVTTGKFHDEHVSMLITAALSASEDEMVTADNLRQWRHRRGLSK